MTGCGHLRTGRGSAGCLMRCCPLGYTAGRSCADRTPPAPKPTALKMMRRGGVPAQRVQLRAGMTGGEPLGAEILSWGREYLGVTINEIYGQTEANLVIGNCYAAWPVVPGSMGRPYPGHELAVLANDGQPAAVWELGEICVRRPDPVMFLRYWNQPEATEEKFRADWLRTGDLAVSDEAGYLWFRSRTDDIINSGGYRIGPAEIEECLLRHPAVAMSAVVGVPDELRGQIEAYVQPRDGNPASPELEEELKQFVRTRLSVHEYSRAVEFTVELPLTTTGKIRRNVLRERFQKAESSQKQEH